MLLHYIAIDCDNSPDVIHVRGADIAKAIR